MRATAALLALVTACFHSGTAIAQSSSALPDSLTLRVDKIFAGFTTSTPGCGVGIGGDGKAVYTRGYGMANLEYGVPNSDQTVFESGSVAKQFTAGALVLLALDGKLSLEDDIRKYIPEVPAFDGGPITIRMLLNHTSGLRDQWGLLGIMGQPPGQRVHSPATTIDLVAHQKMLNFPPGSDFLYSNTGYALAGVIVERVSGKSLDAFTQDRLFQPLGMTGTQWRDDFNEVVKNRATAYGGGRAGLRTNMPITNMIGNGGLLFTVGDVLKWLENLDNPAVGGRAWRDSLLVRGRLKNGKTIPYALGLVHGTYNGVPEISHGGSTAGYQTWIGRYPDQRLSIAVLCNVATAGPANLAHQVADIFLPSRANVAATQQAAGPSVAMTPAELSVWPGTYRDAFTDQVIRPSLRNGTVAVGNPATITIVAITPTHLRGPTVEYHLVSARPNNRRILVIRGDDSTTYDEVAPIDTSAKTLAEYVGTYASDELDVKLALAVRDGRLVVLRRADAVGVMLPVYQDDFTAPGIGSVRFTRDRSGKVTGFSIFAGRVLDVRFRKVSSDPKL